MNALRRGLRLREAEGERSGQQQQVVTSSLEPEATMKTKLAAAWNSVKYGRQAWATQEAFSSGLSRHSPVWLLGRAYHRKLVHSQAESPTGNTVRTFSETDCGIAEFERDFQSRVWLTYRRDIPELGGGVTSDCGWGCMLRSGQMLLAQALLTHWLGRDWRLSSAADPGLEPTERWQTERLHRAVLAVFADSPDTRAAPLSLHAVLRLGRTAGKVAGDWFGPHTAAHLLAAAARSCERGAGAGLLDTVAVYVAQDCTVYRGDVEALCSGTGGKQTDAEDFSLVELPRAGAETARDVEVDGETWCLESPASLTEDSTWKSVIILVPVRLGSEVLNPVYNSCIKNLLTLECCLGIIGGKPRHSLYFVGFQDEDLLHLDPHRLQDRVDSLQPEFPTATFHCRGPRKLPLRRMDPSCCLGFYLRTRTEWAAWADTIAPVVTPPAAPAPGVRPEYPMFVVAAGRDEDTRGQDWVSLGPESSLQSPPANTDMETEEFVFL